MVIFCLQLSAFGYYLFQEWIVTIGGKALMVFVIVVTSVIRHIVVSATAPKNTSRDVHTQPAYHPKFTSLIVYNTFHSIIFNIPFPGTIAL